MWVRSQDKKTLVKVDKLIIAYDTDEKIYEIHNVYDSLGVYKSKERALEVLDEIQRLIEDLKYMELNKEELKALIELRKIDVAMGDMEKDLCFKLGMKEVINF